MATKLQHLTNEISSRVWSALSSTTFPAKQSKIELVRTIRKQRSMLATSQDAWMIASVAESCRDLEGSAAEIGSYRGATAALIASVLPQKTVYACDAFDDGLPPPSAVEQGEYWAKSGNMSSRFDEVRSYLTRWSNVVLLKGYFPQNAAPLADKQFAFVHLDVDMYESTRDSLAWFYSRLTRGAIVITHDWNLCPGTKIAFDEVLRDKPERVIELPTNQAMFVKL